VRRFHQLCFYAPPLIPRFYGLPLLPPPLCRVAPGRSSGRARALPQLQALLNRKPVCPRCHNPAFAPPSLFSGGCKTEPRRELPRPFLRLAPTAFTPPPSSVNARQGAGHTGVDDTPLSAATRSRRCGELGQSPVASACPISSRSSSTGCHWNATLRDDPLGEVAISSPKRPSAKLGRSPGFFRLLYAVGSVHCNSPDSWFLNIQQLWSGCHTRDQPFSRSTG
jgi:hypothetical protein